MADAPSYKIGSNTVATPQIGSKHSIEPVGNWYRGVTATRVGYKIASLKNIVWNYNGLSLAETTTIFGYLGAILDSGTDLVSITSYFPGFGNKTDIYYIKAGSLEVEEVGKDLYKFKLEFGQKEGKQEI